MRDPLSVFAVLVILLIFCGAPLMIIGMVVYAFAFRTPRKKQELADLAQQLGLQPVDDPRRGRLYVGNYQNHNFNLGFGAVRRTRLGPDRIQHRYSLALKIVLELTPNEQLRGYAGCNRYPGPTESFESAFGKARIGMENLSFPSRSAMMEFVRKHGYLWLEGVPLHGPPQPRLQLEHTMMTASPHEVRAMLDEMLSVAHVVESG